MDSSITECLPHLTACRGVKNNYRDMFLLAEIRHKLGTGLGSGVQPSIALLTE